jgi:hypothetical protein
MLKGNLVMGYWSTTIRRITIYMARQQLKRTKRKDIPNSSFDGEITKRIARLTCICMVHCLSLLNSTWLCTNIVGRVGVF